MVDGQHLINSQYDKVFKPSTHQTEIYKFVEGKSTTSKSLTNLESVSDVITGFNCTIFAYGQTGSGKTHTMFGPHWDDANH